MAKKVNTAEPESYRELISTTPEEILNKVKTKEIEVDPKQYGKFMEFTKMDETGRQNFVNSLSPSEPLNDDIKGTPGGNPPGESGISPDKVPSDSEIPPIPSQSDDKVSSESDDDYLVTIDQLRQNVSKLRETSGKLGQSNKTLKEELAEAQAKLREFKERETPPAPVVKMPEVPKVPLESDFVEGYYDPKYKEAMEDYQRDLEKWNQDIATFVTSSKPAWAEELTRSLDDVKQKAEKAAVFADENIQQQQLNEYSQSYQAMWDDVKKLQEATALKTSIPIEVINSNQAIVNGANSTDMSGNPIYSAAEIAAATKVINSLPQSDKDNYRKLVPVVGNLYSFDESGIPHSNYNQIDTDLAWTAALRSTGLRDVQLLVPKNPSAGDMQEKLSQTQQNFAAAPNQMSSSQIGTRENLGNSITTEEKQRKLMEMTKNMKSNPRLLQDKEYMTNFDRMRSELGLARR